MEGDAVAVVAGRVIPGPCDAVARALVQSAGDVAPRAPFRLLFRSVFIEEKALDVLTV